MSNMKDILAEMRDERRRGGTGVSGYLVDEWADEIESLTATIQQRIDQLESFVCDDPLHEGWAGTEVVAKQDVLQLLHAEASPALTQAKALADDLVGIAKEIDREHVQQTDDSGAGIVGARDHGVDVSHGAVLQVTDIGERVAGLRAAAEDLFRFLRHVEWDTHGAETESSDLTMELDARLKDVEAVLEQVALARPLSETETQDASGDRLLLNAYGRECYDAGRASAQRELLGDVVAASRPQKPETELRMKLAGLASEMRENAQRMRDIALAHHDHAAMVSAAGSSATASESYADQLDAILHVCDDSCPANEYHERTGAPLVASIAHPSWQRSAEVARRLQAISATLTTVPVPIIQRNLREVIGLCSEPLFDAAFANDGAIELGRQMAGVAYQAGFEAGQERALPDVVTEIQQWTINTPKSYGTPLYSVWVAVKEIVERELAEAQQAEFIVITIEGFGKHRMPRRFPASAWPTWAPSGYFPYHERSIWRGDEVLYDPRVDDPRKMIELRVDDHLVFTPHGSYY